MQKLSGYKTIIFNLVAIGASWLTTSYGIDLPEEHQTAISVTIISIINIGLRLMTKTTSIKDRRP